MDILQTTRNINYNLSSKHNPIYIQDFKFKFSYLKNISASNHSRENLCGAVFLSYLTMPTWVAIGCNDLLSHNYFLCEINEISSHLKHILNLTVCTTGYTYINAYCWLITTKIPSRDTTADPPISLLSSFLTSWSLGHASRSVISLHPTDTQLTCLSSNDFLDQRLKEWVKSVGCNSSHVLTQRAPFTYHSICQSRLSIV